MALCQIGNPIYPLLPNKLHSFRFPAIFFFSLLSSDMYLREPYAQGFLGRTDIRPGSYALWVPMCFLWPLDPVYCHVDSKAHGRLLIGPVSYHCALTKSLLWSWHCPRSCEESSHPCACLLKDGKKWWVQTSLLNYSNRESKPRSRTALDAFRE